MTARNDQVFRLLTVICCTLWVWTVWTALANAQSLPCSSEPSPPLVKSVFDNEIHHAFDGQVVGFVLVQREMESRRLG
jgi:hypothetical protein